MSSVVEPRTFAAPKIRQTGILIGDEFRSSVSGKTFATVNPATEEVIAEVASATPEDVDAAVKAARAALEKFGELPQDVLEGARRSRFAPPIARRSNKPGTPPAAPAIVPDAQAPTGGAADGAAGDEGVGA